MTYRAIGRMIAVTLAIGCAARAAPPDDDPSSNIFDMNKPGSKPKVPDTAPAVQAPKATPPTAGPTPPVQPPPVAPEPSPPTPPTPVAPTPARLPVPSAANQAAAMKLVRDLYAKEITVADKSADKRADLAVKLLQTGIEETADRNNQFVLFAFARDEAVAASDLRLACRAIDRTAGVFDVEPFKAKAAAATAVARLTIPPADRRLFVLQVAELSAAAVAADRLDVVTTLDDLARSVAAAANDAPLVEQIRGMIAEHTTARVESAQLSTARAALAKNGDDAAALAVVGRYDCFVRDDWTTGVPELARGSDSSVRRAANSEMAGVLSVAGRVAVADDWYDAATAEKSSARPALFAHAARLYSAVAAETSGLTKVKVDKRTAELSAGQTGRPRAVDLLDLIDPTRDAVEGDWRQSPADGGLTSSSGDHVRIGGNYAPPANYDFRVDFTRDSGNDSIDPICTGGAGGRQFEYTLAGWRNTVAGVSKVDGVLPDHNPTTAKGHWLDNGRRYTLVVQIRSDSISTTLDGRPVGREFKTEFRDVGLDYGQKLRRMDTVGLSTWQSSFTIHSAYIVEVSGHGHIVHPDDPADSPVIATSTYDSPGNNHQRFTATYHANGLIEGPGVTGIWYVHGNDFLAEWGAALDTCRFSPSRKSFTGATREHDRVHGEFLDGGF